MGQEFTELKVRIPILTAYNRPLFQHHLSVLLGDAFVRMTYKEGEPGETITVEAAPGQLLPKDLVGFTKAALKSIGIDAQPEPL
jgi:hypothetical protein